MSWQNKKCKDLDHQWLKVCRDQSDRLGKWVMKGTLDSGLGDGGNGGEMEQQRVEVRRCLRGRVEDAKRTKPGTHLALNTCCLLVQINQ